MKSPYTTCFGAMIDDEIAAALASGMTIEAVYCDVAQRARQLSDAIIERHRAQLQTRQEEATACAD